MTRPIALGAALLFFCTWSPGFSQDAATQKLIATLEKNNSLLESQVKTLQEQIAELKNANELLRAEVEELKDRRDTPKADRDTNAKNEKGVETLDPAILPMGSIYEGAWRNYENGAVTTTSNMVMKITKREGNEFEAEMELSKWNDLWIFKGKISSTSQKKQTGGFTGVFTEQVSGDGKKTLNTIGNNSVKGSIGDSGNTLKGTFQRGGSKGYSDFSGKLKK